MNLIKKLFYLFFPIILGSLTGILLNQSINYNTLILPKFAPRVLYFLLYGVLYIF